MNARVATRSARSASALVALFAFASVARAGDKAPADWRNAMTTTAKANNIPSYERTMPNGMKRVYLNPQQQHLAAVEQALPKGSDVIEIMHLGTAEAYHTMAVFDRELLHSQYSQAGNWRLRSWGDRLRSSGNKLWSAMISLTPREAANLRARLAAAKVEEGPEHLAGPNWTNGHLKTGADSALGLHGINCVATWCDMPIGEKGEPLHQLVGLHSYSASPRAFQQALEHDANERVFGIAAYGPAIPDFTANPDQDKTFK